MVSLLIRSERKHAECVAVLTTSQPPMITTWAAFTEAMYFAERRSGWHAQDGLWKLTLRGEIVLMDLGPEERERAHALMRKYRDLPMDLADATLVALAEQLGIRTIFTLDADFGVYRYLDKHAFKVVPAS
jgi:predicted nucleic acid-binding protein